MNIYMLWGLFNSGRKYFVEAKDADEAFKIVREAHPNETINSCQRIEVLKHD